jgi:hypothetical protein
VVVGFDGEVRSAPNVVSEDDERLGEQRDRVAF